MKLRFISLVAVVLLASTTAGAGTVYDNGPQGIHENYGSYAFNGNRYWVSNTFFVPTGSPIINGMSLWLWRFPTDQGPTAELVISSQPNGGGTVYFNQIVQFHESGCYADGFGFSHCQETANWNNGPVLPTATYWITLRNGNLPSDDELFWDANAGVGCQSQGCPSQAKDSFGTIPSETFTILGTSGGSSGTTPKTTSLVMFGAGFVGLVGMVRRALG